MLKDYQCEVTWNGKDYLVEADVYNCGFYEVIPRSEEGPEEIEVIDNPEWFRVEVIDLDTGEPIEKPDSDIINRAVEILNNLYWDRVCWGH